MAAELELFICYFPNTYALQSPWIWKDSALEKDGEIDKVAAHSTFLAANALFRILTVHVRLSCDGRASCETHLPKHGVHGGIGRVLSSSIFRAR